MNLQTIKELTDLQVHDISVVARRLPQQHISTLADIDSVAIELIDLEADYDKKHTERVEGYITGNENIDIFSSIKNATDRNIFIKCSDDELERLSRSIAKKRSELKKYENILKYLKELSLTCKNIIDYERMRSGL